MLLGCGAAVYFCEDSPNLACFCVRGVFCGLGFRV